MQTLYFKHFLNPLSQKKILLSISIQFPIKTKIFTQKQIFCLQKLIHRKKSLKMELFISFLSKKNKFLIKIKNNKLSTKIKLSMLLKTSYLCSINSKILQIRICRKKPSQNFIDQPLKFLMSMNKKSENTKNKKIIIQRIN